MTRKEIEKLPFNIDMLLSESLLVDTKEQVHKKITEVCSLAIKALEQERSRSAEITQYRYDCEKLMEENERLKKALEQALEQEPCEDCISRAEAIKAIRNYDVIIEVGRAIEKSQLVDILDSINKVQEKMISELPSIQPKTDVLDKIRAEIEYIGGDDEKAFCKNLNESYKQGLKDALKVIDKYKAESEE